MPVTSPVPNDPARETSGVPGQERLFVCPLSAVDRMIERTQASHLVTLINDHMMIQTPAAIAQHRHLRVAINDIEHPQDGLVHPGLDHVRSIIDFAHGWDRRSPMLVHCWAGISRSTACSFITLCTLNPLADEREIARSIRAASSTASPNRLMVRVADAVLGRDGRMIRAIEAIGRGESTMEAKPFSLPARF